MNARNQNRRVGIRILLLAPLLALIAGLGVSSPAHAAGDTTRPDIYGCFTWGGGVAYAGQPTFLEWFNFSTNKWVVSRSANPNSAGCVRYNDISPGLYYRLEGYRNYTYPLCRYYDGVSPFVLTARGDSLYRVGTNYVSGPYSYYC